MLEHRTPDVLKWKEPGDMLPMPGCRHVYEVSPSGTSASISAWSTAFQVSPPEELVNLSNHLLHSHHWWQAEGCCERIFGTRPFDPILMSESQAAYTTSSGAGASSTDTHLFRNVLKEVVVILTPPPEGLHDPAASILQSIDLQREPLLSASIVQDASAPTTSDGAR